jgi:acyl carrier protein
METKIINEIKQLIHNEMGIHTIPLFPESDFRDDLGFESLDLVELTLLVEIKYNIDIEDDLAIGIRSAQDLIIAIKSKTR